MSEFGFRDGESAPKGRTVTILKSAVRRYRPRGQNVTAFQYTDPGQVDELLDWLSRIEGRAVHGRVTGDGVVEIQRGFGEEVSIGPGSFVLRSPAGGAWRVVRPSTFLARFEPLPFDAPFFADDEVA